MHLDMIGLFAYSSANCVSDYYMITLVYFRPSSLLINSISLRRQHMRNVLALGAAVLFIGSVGVAGAQERLPQSSSGSGFGVGAGVGDRLGTRVAYRRLIGAHSLIGSVRLKPCMAVARNRCTRPQDAPGDRGQLTRRRPCRYRGDVSLILYTEHRATWIKSRC